MVVIADATPLRYLVEINCSDILFHLFERVLIPTAVAQELNQPRTLKAVRAWLKNPPSWLEIRQVRLVADASLAHLDAGECEAILLAQEAKADWLIIDELQERREAARRHIPVLGTVRVLDEAAARRLISLPDVISKLQGTTFYISPELLDWLLNREADRQRQV
jgi:predicted nucleic acid-binding protein